MKKLIASSLFAAAALLSANSVLANGTPAPEAEPSSLEISGVVDVVAGYQHDDKDALGGLQGGLADNIIGATAADADHFRMVVDQVEIDLQKSFGENIRLRADLDFNDFGNTGHRVTPTMDIEQAYVTANLAAGNGIEFLFGTFNAPVGVDTVDRNENWLISYSSPFRYFTPTNVTGAKLYYAFSDLIDLHVAVVNDLNSNGFATDSAMPSSLFRLGFNWGSDDNKSTLGLSGGAGPEQAGNAHWDFYGDIDAMIALSDTIKIAGEGVYRQSNNLVAGQNQKGIAGFLALNYQASDVWDITFRGDYAWDVNPDTGSGASTTGANWIGFEGTQMGGSVGAGYQIADGAKMKLEYRFDYAKTASAALLNSDYHSVLAEFAYSF